MGRRTGFALASVVTAFAGVTTYVGSISGAPPDFLVLDFVTGMSFVLTGLAAVWLRPRSRAGPALLVSGALWYVGSYGPSGQPVVMHLGFAFEGYYDLVLAMLLLAMSSSTGRVEPRAVVVLLAASMAVRSMGRLLLADPAQLGCGSCPPNPFAVFADRVAFERIELVSNLAIAALIALVALLVLRRLVVAGPVLRRVRAPILVAGGLATAAAALAAFEYAWGTATGLPLIALPEPWDSTFSWSTFAARTLVPVAFLVATLRLRSAPGPVGRFTAGLEEAGGATTVEAALRTALGDPTLRLLRPAGDGLWVAEDGSAMTLPSGHGGLATTLVGPAERPLAALVHDAALRDQLELVDAVVRVLRLALENERLEAELREQLRAVTESRHRIVTAAEEERRRLERDLHDGAQQRLVGVTLALQQARGSAAAAAAPGQLREQLDAAAHETALAIRELRELARGVHPAILEDEGLGPAVAALARRAAIPVEVRASLDDRLAPLVESTAYFTIAEALTNTQRHARATHATVLVAGTRMALELEIADDGQGGADPTRGSGLRGLQDRVTAVGGTFDVDSPVGAGTRIRATIPTG